MRATVAEIEVVVPNFKRRLSGVTSTIVQLVPGQAEHVGIAALGPGIAGRRSQARVGGRFRGCCGDPSVVPFASGTPGEMSRCWPGSS